MKITQITDQCLVIETKSARGSWLYIALLCGFLWLHWAAWEAVAALWVHLLIGAFTVMLIAIVWRAPERGQVVFDRAARTARLHRQKGPVYETHDFDLADVSGFEINPESEGFRSRPGPMERVYTYLTIASGMDEGRYILSYAPKSHHRTLGVLKRASAWLAQGRT